MNRGAEEPQTNPGRIAELELKQQQSRESEPKDVKEERQSIDDEPEQPRSDMEQEQGEEGNGRVPGTRSGVEEQAESKIEDEEEIKGEPDRNGDASVTMGLPILDSAEGSSNKTNDIPHENAEATLEIVSNQQLLVEGRTAAEFVPTMGDRNAVQDDAAVATMPPRADQIPESMGLFPGAIDNATFMAYMQTPANFYGMGTTGMDVNGSLSLPQTSADGLLALQMASTMNMNPFSFGEPTLDPSPNIGDLDTIVEDHHRVVSISQKSHGRSLA